MVDRPRIEWTTGHPLDLQHLTATQAGIRVHLHH